MTVASPYAVFTAIKPSPSDSEKEATKAFQALLDWADNEDATMTTTWDVFLSLTNNWGIDENGDQDVVVAKPMGFLEGDLLAKALAGWTSYPKALNKFFES